MIAVYIFIYASLFILSTYIAQAHGFENVFSGFIKFVSLITYITVELLAMKYLLKTDIFKKSIFLSYSLSVIIVLLISYFIFVICGIRSNNLFLDIFSIILLYFLCKTLIVYIIIKETLNRKGLKKLIVINAISYFICCILILVIFDK